MDAARTSSTPPAQDQLTAAPNFEDADMDHLVILIGTYDDRFLLIA